MGDNSAPSGRRHHIQKFFKAMQVVKSLNIHIQNIINRHNRIRDIHPAYVSALHRRLMTLEGVRSLYLEYARIQMSNYSEVTGLPGDESEESISDCEPELFDCDSASSDSVDESISDNVSDRVLEESGCESDSEDDDLPEKSLVGYQRKDRDDAVRDNPEPTAMSSLPYSANRDTGDSIEGLRDNCDDLVSHVQDQLADLAFPSDEGDVTLDELSDDEMDPFALQDITYSRV